MHTFKQFKHCFQQKDIFKLCLRINVSMKKHYNVSYETFQAPLYSMIRYIICDSPCLIIKRRIAHRKRQAIPRDEKRRIC